MEIAIYLPQFSLNAIMSKIEYLFMKMNFRIELLVEFSKFVIQMTEKSNFRANYKVIDEKQ